MTVKISQLPAGAALTGVEEVPIVQSSTTVRVLMSAIGAYVRGLFTTTPLTIAEGGTGASTAALARAALSAAESGVNSDITSLTGLTTPIPFSEGGSGETTQSAALTALLGTDKIPIVNGGTNAATETSARKNLGANPLVQDYIGGLLVNYASASSLTVSKGAAYVPSVGDVISYSGGTLNVTGLTASTWYYVYLKSDGTINYSTIAPDAPYFGTARCLASDNSQRFIGYFLTTNTSGVSAVFFNQILSSHRITSILNNGIIANGVLLSSGIATTWTAVDASSKIPQQGFMSTITFAFSMSVQTRFKSHSLSGESSLFSPPTSGTIAGMVTVELLEADAGAFDYQLIASGSGTTLYFSSAVFVR